MSQPERRNPMRRRMDSLLAQAAEVARSVQERVDELIAPPSTDDSADPDPDGG